VDDNVGIATAIEDEIAAEMRLVSHMRLDGWTGDFCVAARSYHLKPNTNKDPIAHA
jgi:hypothetical protein